ncbi:MAG: cytochrome c [Phyllobacteriaceae bacterium]|jgi:mono/diheme cytochrome c family protein|nr:cytochrome c [Phyllobacteriaceae bacterium]
MIQFRKPRVATTAAVFLAVLASAASAQDDTAVAKGKSLAEANCAICHAIYETGTSPLAIAPPFRDIATTYDEGELEDAFNDGVATDHPAMPDWQMTPDQAHALATYIMGLVSAGKQKTDIETIGPDLAGAPVVNP